MFFLVEGGNIWDDVTTGFDPSTVGKPLTQATQKILDPLGVRVNTVGSAWKPRFDKNGNVVPSNDLDAMLDLAVLQQSLGTTDSKTTRKALSQYLQSKGIETKLAGVTVHSRIPLGDNFYQVDLKVVPNAAKVAQFHRHEIPQGSPYKGVNKQLVMNTIATNKGFVWSPDEGLYKRNSLGQKSELLTTEWDEIAQYLLGPNSTGKDLGSVESILAKIPEEQREEIMNKARSSASWRQGTPELSEWFRRTMDMLV